MSVSILVVDDEPDVAELFRQRFRREARQGTYVMHFASSGEDALSKLNNGVDPQLIVILSDINMPGMEGLTLLGEIKRRWPELPVMMVTAYGVDERRRRADEYGAAEFITKPVDFEMLKERLRQLPGGPFAAVAVVKLAVNWHLDCQKQEHTHHECESAMNPGVEISIFLVGLALLVAMFGLGIR